MMTEETIEATVKNAVSCSWDCPEKKALKAIKKTLKKGDKEASARLKSFLTEAKQHEEALKQRLGYAYFRFVSMDENNEITANFKDEGMIAQLMRAHMWSLCAQWAFANYTEWREVKKELGDMGAYIGLHASLGRDIDEDKEKEVVINNARIKSRWERVEAEIAKLPKNLLIRPSRVKQKAGALANYTDNEIIANLFPTGEVGEKDISTYSNDQIGKIRLDKELKPLDKMVYASLIVSIRKNEAPIADGRKFYYITKVAFARAFFGLGKNGVHQEELEIIERSVERLLGARFLDIHIEEAHTSKRIEYKPKKPKSKEGLYTGWDYLPLHLGGKDSYILTDNGEKAEVWMMDKAYFHTCPLVQIADKMDRTYVLCMRLIPKGIKKTEELLNAVSCIFSAIERWYPKMDNHITIDLSVFHKYNEQDTYNVNIKKRISLVSRLVGVLRHFQNEGLCTWAIGKKDKNGNIDFFHDVKDSQGRKVKENGKPKRIPNYLSPKIADKDIRYVMLCEVNKKNPVWQKWTNPSQDEDDLTIDAEIKNEG